MSVIDEAYRRFSKERFPLPSEAQLEALEQRIGITFPDDYRRFILDYNGGYFICPEITPVGDGCPLEMLDSVFGIGASHQSSELASPSDLVIFEDNNPPKILPIGGTPLGGLIILDTAPGDGRGEIYLKQAWGDFYWIAENIEAFFGLLREPTWE